MTLRAMMVTAELTYLGDQIARYTPPDACDGGLGAFLDRVSRRLGDDGVVLVDPVVAGKLGLPAETLPEPGTAGDHPAVAAAAAAGWKTREVYRWSHFTKGTSRVRVGLTHHIDPAYCPLLSPHWHQDTTSAMSRWHAMTGYPYWGDAGDAVNEIIKGTARIRINGKPGRPAWWWHHPDGFAPVERPYSRKDWDNSAGVPGRYLHGYDAVRAYLAAMSIVEVAPLGLRESGPRPFDPKLAGWWLVDLAPWTLAHMPDPAGYPLDRPPVGGQGRPDPRWVTTPRLALITKLVEEGVHGGFEVVKARVSKAERGVMRPAAELLRQTWDAAAGLPDPQDRDMIRAGVKDGFHAMHGKWRSTQSEIQRADWAATLAATAACTLWIKMWKAGQNTTGGTYGRWPAYVNGIDTVYYASDSPDPTVDLPHGFKLVDPDKPDTDRLGAFVPKYLIDRGAAA